MRGSLKQRYRGSWSIILDLGYEPHPDTGKLRRRQKWVTFRGTRAQAEKKLTPLLGTLDAGTYVDTTKITLGEWLAGMAGGRGQATAAYTDLHRVQGHHRAGPAHGADR